MKTTTIQFANNPVGRRKRMIRMTPAFMLAILAPLCMGQAVSEGAQLANSAKPPVATIKGPADNVSPPAATPVETAPLRTPPPAAGPMQAFITGPSGIPAAFSAVSHAPAESNVMHIVTGHQVFIDTRSRLRRVYVADPTVLSSVTLTPNQIAVTAVGPGISSLTLLDEIGRTQSYMISSDLDIDSLRGAMEAALSNDHINIQGSGGRVVLTGVVPSQAVADAAVKLAGMYSKEVVNAMNIAPGHPKQVRLQVRILEVDRAKAQQFGINLFNPGGNTSFLAATTTTQYPSTATATAASIAGQGIQVLASNPLNFFLYSARANLGATIQDLQTKQVLQILAEPTITTISGEKGEFLSGGEFPVPIAQPGGSGSAAVITVQWRPYGVKLDFTPIVNDDGTIRLTVSPEVSALDYSNAVTISGATIPALSTRKASTQVELRSDQSFAISGLLDQRTTDLLDKNPGISSIPILGELFKSKNTNHSTTELVVVVTPSVVDPLTDSAQPAQPDLPIPTLDRPGFDQSLGKNRNPRPAAPSLDPNRPPYGDAVPAPLPPQHTADGMIVGDSVSQMQNEPAQPQTGPAAATPTNTPATDGQAGQVAAPSMSTPLSSTLPAPSPIRQPASAHMESAAPASPAPHPDRPTPASAPSPGQTSANEISAEISSGALQSAQPASSPTLVEIMVLSHESDADATLSALRHHGYNPSVNRNAQDSLLHLDLGPFASRSEAEAMRQRLTRDGYDASLK